MKWPKSSSGWRKWQMKVQRLRYSCFGQRRQASIRGFSIFQHRIRTNSYGSNTIFEAAQSLVRINVSTTPEMCWCCTEWSGCWGVCFQFLKAGLELERIPQPLLKMRDNTGLQTGETEKRGVSWPTWDTAQVLPGICLPWGPVSTKFSSERKHFSSGSQKSKIDSHALLIHVFVGKRLCTPSESRFFSIAVVFFERRSSNDKVAHTDLRQMHAMHFWNMQWHGDTDRWYPRA